jgi:hypothetical protein
MVVREGMYEIFSHRGITRCFDDPSLGQVDTQPEMFVWIKEQDASLWRGLKNWPNDDTAYYLKPELYLMWKLKFA